MKISVCIATYNGEPYIEQQLKSIIKQTCRPDEIVVCDDASSDKTLRTVRHTKQKTSVSIEVHENEERLGYSKNFEKAINLASGDVIFISDQDDFWFKNKISRVVTEMDHNNDYVFINDCYFADKNLTTSGDTKLGRIRSAGISDTSFVSGCCTAIRGNIKSIFLPIPVDHFSYDLWIHKLSDAINRRRVINEPLQKYRRHGGNTSQWHINNGNTPSRIEKNVNRFWKDTDKKYQKRLNRLDIIYRRLESHKKRSTIHATKEIKNIFKRKKYLKKRLKCRRKDLVSRMKIAAKMFYNGKYSNFSGWKSMLRDMAGL